MSNDAVFALPEPFNYAEGAAFTVAARTAYHALVEGGELQTGERLLVLGATGGVGFAAVQLAKLFGRRLWRSDPTTPNSPRSWRPEPITS